MLTGIQITRIYAHPLRQRILSHLQQHGPATQTEIARALDMAPASARHHLLKLIAAGFVLQKKTRPGPKGIIEKLFELRTGKLFELRTEKKGRKPMQWATKHGSKEDLIMRKLNLDEVLETHRVGSRIIMRDPKAYFSLYNAEAGATREELTQLRDKLAKTLLDFLTNLPAPAKRPKGQELQQVKIHFGIYPQHPRKP